MEATLILADAAARHSDGTISLLRGGIDRLRLPRGLPLQLNAALAARIQTTPGESGKVRRFSVVCSDYDGNALSFKVEGEFKVEQGAAINMVVPVSVTFPKHDHYRFELLVDGTHLAEWAIIVEPPKGKEKR